MRSWTGLSGGTGAAVMASKYAAIQNTFLFRTCFLVPVHPPSVGIKECACEARTRCSVERLQTPYSSGIADSPRGVRGCLMVQV